MEFLLNWCIKKSPLVENFIFYDIEISIIILRLTESQLIFHGIWIPYDNGTEERVSGFKSNLFTIKGSN